jgi:hypothetical protein
MGSHAVELIVTVVVSVIASSGFWAFLSNRLSTKNAHTELLMALACDRIVSIGREYIKHGSIASDDYKYFLEELYEPYERAGGNGYGKKIKLEIDKLPVID